MPHKIYVGNYPMSFAEDDVLNIFQDFEGVELVGFFQKENKCFSFLHCMNERQLIEIIVNMHDIDVCGRNLIVRAADENLHKRIQKSMLEHGAVAANVHPRNTCDLNNSTSGSYVFSETRRSKQSGTPQAITSESKNNYQKKYQMGSNAGHASNPNTYNSAKRGARQNDGVSNKYENQDYSSYYPESDYSSQLNSHSAPTYSNGAKEKYASSYSQNISESEREDSVLGINPQDTFSRACPSPQYKTMNERFDSYNKTKSMHNREGAVGTGHQGNSSREQHQPRYRNSSESSLDTAHNVPPSQQYEKLNFVSVMNFPLRMPVRDIYKLFSDFNPIKVFIVCNEPRVERTPTEAIICFESEKDATEAILTLDNTVYRGRILIVTDAVDMSLVSELLSFG